MALTHNIYRATPQSRLVTHELLSMADAARTLYTRGGNIRSIIINNGIATAYFVKLFDLRAELVADDRPNWHIPVQVSGSLVWRPPDGLAPFSNSLVVGVNATTGDWVADDGPAAGDFNVLIEIEESYQGTTENVG